MISLPAAGTDLGSLFAAHPTTPAVPNPDSSPQTRKLYQQCQQFEAVLISNLWSEMEEGASMTDFGSDPGAATMQGLGIQSAATGLANAGGLGIARMLYQKLAASLPEGDTSTPMAKQTAEELPGD